jgi:hypothetical protein
MMALHLVKALAGPIVWAAHFFFLYLTEAFACTGQGSSTAAVRWIGIAATLVALAVLALFSIGLAGVRHQTETAATDSALGIAVPLAVLSMVAIIWTSIPLFLFPACVPGSI